jgi:paraquat-inducible protein B
MSLRARKLPVIAFILGAFAVGAIMVYSFGGRETFARHETFLLYFKDSVNGLGPGSEVRFKGVPIGLVQSVRLGSQVADGNQRVLVIIQLNADRLLRQLGVLEDLTDPATLAREVRRGLRAQLQTQSHVTGGMFVEIEYYPNEPPPAANLPSADLREIPTIPSDAVAGLQKIQKIALWLPTFDFQAKLNQVGDYLDSITTKVSVIPYAEYHQNVVAALTPLANFNPGPWQNSFGKFLACLDAYHASLALANDKFSASAQGFVAMSDDARAQLEQSDAALARARAALNPDAPWLSHLTHNLQALSSDMGNLTAKLNATAQQPDLLPKAPK